MSLESRIKQLEHRWPQDSPRTLVECFTERLNELIEADKRGEPIPQSTAAENLRELDALPPPHPLDWKEREWRERFRKIYQQEVEEEASRESEKPR